MSTKNHVEEKKEDNNETNHDKTSHNEQNDEEKSKDKWLTKWSRSEAMMLEKLTSHCTQTREKAYGNFDGSFWSYWNATMIIPNFLYLGDRSSAIDIQQLKKTKITYLLNCAGPKCTEYVEYDAKIFTIHMIDAQDNQKCQIINDYIHEAIEFIEKAKQNKQRILVHCVGGVNRSATMVAAYLLHIKYKKDIYEVAAFLINKRTSVLRNRQFLKQLIQYQSYLHAENRPKNKEKSD